MTLLPQLLGFALTVLALTALSRWVGRQVQVLGLRLTGDEQVAVMVYYLLLLPGIFLHELSHFVMARLLGLKVGKFSLWPRRRGRSVELGSVTVSSGGALRNSLVGLAPFLTGTAVLVAVGYLVFDVALVGRAWEANGWAGGLGALNGIWRVSDFWLWAYAIVVVSNTMTPSPADRQPWLAAALYLGIALLLAYLLGGLPVLPPAVGAHVAGTLQLLTLAFLFTLALDLVAAAVLWALERVIIWARGARR